MGGGPLSQLSPSPLSHSTMLLRSLNDKPTRDYQGLPFEGWMLFPSFFVGAVFDDNVLQSTTNRVAAAGLKIRPSIVAERDAGIHHTTVFANGDFNFYPDVAGGNTTNAQIGFAHNWEPMRDLVFKIGGEYDRHTDIYNNGVVTNSFGTSGLIASPQSYNTFGGYVSGLKTIGRFFVGLSAGSTATTYETLYTTTGPVNQTYRDNLVTTVTGRLGYTITPLIYAYTEAAGNFHNFNGDTVDNLLAPNLLTPGTIYNNQGYRVVGGLGSDRISLFQGEIYAGYQQQIYDYTLFGAPSSPVYGGRISWFPTRAVTVTAALDEFYQDSGLALADNYTGSAAHVTSATINAQYAMSRQWTASLGGGYSDVLYLSGGRHDHRWTTGSTLNYEIWRNLSATLNYSLVLVDFERSGRKLHAQPVFLGRNI